MLILTRKPGESLYIGDKIKITIVEIKGHQIRVGIDAPTDLRIYREEIYLQILEENRRAAEASEVSAEDLEGLRVQWGSDDEEGAKGKLKVKSLAAFSVGSAEKRVPDVVVKRKRKDGK